MKKFKKFIFPGAAILFSFYLSILFALGGIIGYLTTKHFCRKYIGKGKIKPLIFKCGSWKLHFHHWLMGCLVFLLISLGGWLSFIPNFCLGTVGGFIFQDIYCDKEWYKVIFRKRAHSSVG